MIGKAQNHYRAQLHVRTTMTKKIINAYGLEIPLVPVPHLAEFRTRAPTSTDRDFAIGDGWIYKVTADTRQSYQFGGLDSNGDAIWIINGPGDSDVDTLTGDSGGAISPTAGTIILAGGTNITTAGTAGPGTITFNLDAAITLATSVTSPIYTSAADVAINASAGNDVIVTLGDSAGATNFIVQALDGTDHFTVASDGTITFSGLTVSGAFTSSGGAISLNDNSNFNTTINTGTSTGTVTVGSANAGAIAVDTGAGISLDGATASNFTVTGASADLTLSSVGGSVNIDGSEAAADAISIQASNAAGGIDCDSGTGGTAIDSTGAISLDAAAASNFSVSGAGIDLSLVSAGGRVVMNGEEAAADALRLLSAAGGLDTDVALQMSLVSSQAAADAIVINASGGGIDITASTNDLDLTATAASANLVGGEAAADAVRINASNAAGGIDVDAGTAGIAIDSTGAISLDAAAASNFSVSGAGIDLNLASAAGRIILTSGEDAADTIYLHADAGTSETIRLHSDQGTGAASVHLESDVGGVTLTSGLASADAINLAAASGGIDMDGALQINIASSQAAADAIRLVASDAAGGVTLECGTGNVNVTGGNLVLSDVATQIEMNGGAVTDFIGTGTLTNGQVTIANTNIAANDRIFIQRLDENSSTALGMFQYQISAGASFTVESKDPATPANDETGDQSTFVYIIFRQN